MATTPCGLMEFTEDGNGGGAPPSVAGCTPCASTDVTFLYQGGRLPAHSCALVKGRRDSSHHGVYFRGFPRVFALLCFAGLLMAQTPLLPASEKNSAEHGNLKANDTVRDFVFTWAAQALENPLKQQGTEAYDPADSKPRQLTDILSGLAQVRLPEGILESLQSVDWGALLSTGAAGLEVAVAEGRQYLKDWMQSGRVQQFLRTLQVEKLEESLESLLENLGVVEKLPAQLMRERRTLEVSFVPIFVFARERVLERSRDEEEAALKIALGDHQLKAVVKQFEDVPPARSMSTAPSTLDAMHENLVKVTTVLMESRPIALSLALRVELLTQEFVEYCQPVFSALTRYISSVNRFHKNRRALFFFAQHTLPRVTKILLLLNRLEDHFLQRARSDFAESAEQSAALRREAKRLSAQTAALITHIGNVAHGCLAATSPPFQVEFAKALSAYDHGENPLNAFKSFVEVPTELIGQKDSMFQPQQQTNGTARGTLLRQKQHEDRRIRADATLSDRRGNGQSDDSEQRSSRSLPRAEARQDLAALEATEYINMMRKHLREVHGAQRRYTDESLAASPLRQVSPPETQGAPRGEDGAFRETPLQYLSPATRDAGTPGSAVDMEAFLNASPILFIAPPSASAVTKPASAVSADFTLTPAPSLVANTDSGSRDSVKLADATAGEGETDKASADTPGDSVLHGTGVRGADEDGRRQKPLALV